jgi:hypothetical protein
MAQIDFEGKSFMAAVRPLVKDEIYEATCVRVEDNLVTFMGQDGNEKTRILLRWKLPSGEELTQFTSVDVKINVGKYSATSSYSFLEKAKELETFKMMASGKSEIDDGEVLAFFKTCFIGRKAKILTKTATDKNGVKYSVIDRFVEVYAKA